MMQAANAAYADVRPAKLGGFILRKSIKNQVIV